MSESELTHQSGLVVLYTLFAKVEDAGLAAVAGRHAGLELRIVVHTTVGFVITHAHPGLLNVLV